MWRRPLLNLLMTSFCPVALTPHSRRRPEWRHICGEARPPIVVHNQNAAHYGLGLPPSIMRLTDSAIDRVKIFASANQCVILISALMGATVCPARCLGPIMEPTGLHNQPSPTCGDAQLTETSPRPQALRSTHHLCNPWSRHSRRCFSIPKWSSWSGTLSWLKPSRRRPVSTQGGLACRQCASEGFLLCPRRHHFSIRTPAAGPNDRRVHDWPR
jgi:hypothetical protein